MPPERKPQSAPKKTSAERTRAYRARMRARGLKPVTTWAVDTNDPEFLRRIHEACIRLNDDPEEQRVLDELEAFQADFEPWE